MGLSPWSCVRFSHHAKNRMRQYGITEEDIRAFIVAENRCGADPDGNPVYVGEIRGVRLRLILALDDMSTVITVYPRRR